MGKRILILIALASAALPCLANPANSSTVSIPAEEGLILSQKKSTRSLGYILAGVGVLFLFSKGSDNGGFNMDMSEGFQLFGGALIVLGMERSPVSRPSFNMGFKGRRLTATWTVRRW